MQDYKNIFFVVCFFFFGIGKASDMPYVLEHNLAQNIKNSSRKYLGQSRKINKGSGGCHIWYLDPITHQVTRKLQDGTIVTWYQRALYADQK